MKSVHFAKALILAGLLVGATTMASAHDGIIPGVKSALQQANTELDAAENQLTTGNLTLSSDDEHAPKAEITPQDRLLIEGQPVSLDGTQQAYLHDYRAQVIAIGLDGIRIGRRGTEIGMHAVGPMILKALFGADDDSIEREMQEKLAPIQQDVLKLCDRLPALMASERQLAAALPAFKPYANMREDDIDDCREEALDLSSATASSAKR